MSTDATEPSVDRNVANDGRVDTNVDATSDAERWARALARALALATALDAFLGAGMVDHARPVVRELVGVLRASEADHGAEVIPIAPKRRNRP
jgi:hypothetical protein